MSTYKIGNTEVQSVTTIIGAQSDKSALMKWYARMVVEWIEGECEWNTWEDDISEGYYTVRDTDLKKAVEHAPNEGERAMKIGSNVHSYIERFLNARRKCN